MDYLSYSHFLTKLHTKEGNQEQPDSGLLAISQLKQVYGTVYIYQRLGILRFVPSRVGVRVQFLWLQNSKFFRFCL